MKKIFRVDIQHVFDKSEPIETIENIRTAKDVFNFYLKLRLSKKV